MPGKKSRLISSSWKEAQSKRKKSRTLKLALFVLSGVLGLLIISWTIRFTQSLFSPWKITPQQQKSYLWNGQFNINVLIRSEGVSLLSYNPKESKIVLVNIPDETFVEVPYGFGLWQLRAVWKLGESQKLLGGDKLLKDTLNNFFAIPIDGFLDLSALKPSKSAASVLNNLKKNPFSGLELLAALKTDLTVWELIRLKIGIGGVRFDKIREKSLTETLDKTNLPDGSVVLTADPVKLDSILADLADPTIVSEHKSIAVFNATNQPLLAQKAARLISNLGGNVIITTNADRVFAKTTLEGVKSATLERLRQIFILDDKISTKETVTSRAEINLLLGEDYISK